VTDLHDVMRRRANCMRHISIADRVFSNTMPTAVTAAMLGSQCGSLLTLRIATEETGLADADRHIAALATLTRLQRLEVCRHPCHGVLKLASCGPLAVNAANKSNSNGFMSLVRMKAAKYDEPVVTLEDVVPGTLWQMLCKCAKQVVLVGEHGRHRTRVVIPHLLPMPSSPSLMDLQEQESSRKPLCCFQVVMCDKLFQDHGATLLWTVQQLPALSDLVIDYEGSLANLDAPVSDRHGLPRCAELAALHSRSLIRLKVCMLGGPEEGNMLRLCGLPQLQSCDLAGHPELPLNMRIDASSFQGCPQLESLRVSSDEAFHLQHDSLAQLSALTSLTLVRCGLRKVPDVVPLSATLRELILPWNDCLQLDSDAVASVLQCSQLRILDLCKQDISERWPDKIGAVWPAVASHMSQDGFTPSQWSSQSVMNIARLPTAFRRRHKRFLDFKCY